MKNDGSGEEVIDGPDYINGYGLLNVEEAIEIVKDGSIIEDTINLNNTHKYQLAINDKEDIKITLAWDDLSANPSHKKMLINDLDLYVLSPSGKKFYPWTLNLSDLEAPAIRSKEDHLNVIEQVYITSEEVLEEGLDNWSIVVNASELESPVQEYSLVSSNKIKGIDNEDGSEEQEEMPQWFYDNLVAYYPFNANAQDESSNEHDGEINGATFVEDRFGNSNSALYFDGINDSVGIGELEEISGNVPRTISLWFRINESVPIGKDYSLFNIYNPKRNIRENFNIKYENNKGDRHLALRVTGNKVWKINNLEDGKWHSLVIIYNGERLTDSKLYIDGEEEVNVRSFYRDGVLNTVPSETSIGGTVGANKDYTKGIIDDVIIWNRTLSNNEMGYLFLN